jgi:hypothetical protein
MFINVMLFLLILSLSLLSAWLVAARIRILDRALFALVALVVFHLFTIIPVQLVAAAELVGLIESVNLKSISIVSTALFIFALGFHILMGTGDRQAEILRDRVPMRIASWLLVSIIAIISVAWLCFAIDTVASYDLGWDGLAYHLPMIVTWMQEESFAIPEISRWQHSLPANGELGMYLLLAAGLDRAVFLYNWLAFAVGALAVFVLARRVTGSFDSSILSAAIFASVPAVQYQASSAYIDLYGACFVLAAVALFMERSEVRPEQGGRWYISAIALAGLACGIGIGAKPIYYAYGALCGVGAAGLVWWDQKRNSRKTILVSAFLAACMLVPSIFWLSRAMAGTGNPFYPIAVSLMGVQVFDGYRVDEITQGARLDHLFVSSNWQWLIYPWIETKVSGPPYGTGSGLGAAWTTFVPLGIGFSVLYAVRQWRQGRGHTILALVVLLVAMVALWWFGLRRLPRFGLVFVGLSCVMAAPLFVYLLSRRRLAAQILIAAAFGSSVLLSSFDPLHGLLGRVRAGVWDRAGVFEMPALIDTLPDRSVIWNAGATEAMNFALAGARLSNRVVYKRWSRTSDPADFVRQHGIQYLAERAPFCCADVRSLGARLIFEGRVGPTHDWRIWAMPGA